MRYVVKLGDVETVVGMTYVMLRRGKNNKSAFDQMVFYLPKGYKKIKNIHTPDRKFSGWAGNHIKSINIE